MNRLQFVFLKRHLHLKPIEASLFGCTSVLIEANLFESALDDLRRYGLRVAVINVVTGVRMLSLRWSERHG